MLAGDQLLNAKQAQMDSSRRAVVRQAEMQAEIARLQQLKQLKASQNQRSIEASDQDEIAKLQVSIQQLQNEVDRRKAELGRGFVDAESYRSAMYSAATVAQQQLDQQRQAEQVRFEQASSAVRQRIYDQSRLAAEREEWRQKAREQGSFFPHACFVMIFTCFPTDCPAQQHRASLEAQMLKRAPECPVTLSTPFCSWQETPQMLSRPLAPHSFPRDCVATEPPSSVLVERAPSNASSRCGPLSFFHCDFSYFISDGFLCAACVLNG